MTVWIAFGRHAQGKPWMAITMALKAQQHHESLITCDIYVDIYGLHLQMFVLPKRP